MSKTKLFFTLEIYYYLWSQKAYIFLQVAAFLKAQVTTSMTHEMRRVRGVKEGGIFLGSLFFTALWIKSLIKNTIFCNQMLNVILFAAVLFKIFDNVIAKEETSLEMNKVQSK